MLAVVHKRRYTMLAVVHKRRYTNVLSSEWGERGICMAIGGSKSCNQKEGVCCPYYNLISRPKCVGWSSFMP